MLLHRSEATNYNRKRAARTRTTASTAFPPLKEETGWLLKAQLRIQKPERAGNLHIPMASQPLLITVSNRR